MNYNKWINLGTNFFSSYIIIYATNLAWMALFLKLMKLLKIQSPNSLLYRLRPTIRGPRLYSLVLRADDSFSNSD